MAQAPRDENHVPSLLAASSTDGITPVVVYADPTTHRLYVDASVTLSSVSGNLSNNTAAPSSDNIGALTAVASVAAPSYTDGRQVLLSTDLSGSLRVVGSLSVGGTTDNSAFVAGTSTGTPSIGFYHSVIDVVTDGNAAVMALTPYRGCHVNLRNQAGQELGIAATPLQVSLGNTAGNATAIKVDGSAVTQPVSIAASVAVTNAGTFAVQAAQSGNWTARLVGNGGAVLDGVVTAAASPANGVMQLGIYNSTEPSPTTGQSVGIQLDSKGRQRGVIMDAAGNTRGANVDASNRLSVTVDAFTATNASVNVAQMNGVAVSMGSGTNGTGVQRVTIATDQGALAAWGKGATAAAVPSGAQYTGFIASTANPSAATAGNMVGGMADKLGRQVVVVGQVRDLKGNQVTTITSSTSETTVVTAVASTFLDVYGCIVVNSSATATNVTFKDSTAGTTQFNVYVPAGETRGFMLPSSDGFKQTTVNTNWTATCGTSVASVIITMLYVKNI